MKGSILIGVAALAGVLAGCGPIFQQCTSIAAYGLIVTVNDAATGQAICDATVTVVDGSYRETLDAKGSPGCQYVGATERKGTYTLTANKSGYTAATQSGVVVLGDECHVHGVSVTLSLTH